MFLSFSQTLNQGWGDGIDPQGGQRDFSFLGKDALAQGEELGMVREGGSGQPNPMLL